MRNDFCHKHNLVAMNGACKECVADARIRKNKSGGGNVSKTFLDKKLGDKKKELSDLQIELSQLRVKWDESVLSKNEHQTNFDAFRNFRDCEKKVLSTQQAIDELWRSLDMIDN